MSAGMAEVIKDHRAFPNDTRVEKLHCTCGRFVTANDDFGTWNWAAHVADELTKAGYGNVREAKREAWTEGFSAGWAEAEDPGAFVNDVWDAKTPNPYREAPHGVD